MKILALDLASETGFYTGNNSPGFIKFEREVRTVEFYRWLSDMVFVDGQATFDIIVVENAIMQKAFANEVFHELKAVVKLVCGLAQIPIHEIAPARVKKLFAGRGGAKKEEIIAKCLSMGVDVPYRVMKSGPDKGNRRYNDNAADAVAVYHSYLIEKGIEDDIQS